MRRGTKHAAAHAHTMHIVAARTDRQLLPTIVAALPNRNDQRCAELA